MTKLLQYEVLHVSRQPSAFFFALYSTLCLLTNYKSYYIYSKLLFEKIIYSFEYFYIYFDKNYKLLFCNFYIQDAFAFCMSK